MKTLIQYTIQSGAAIMTCFLDEILMIGDQVTLKGDLSTEWWTVKEVHQRADLHELDKHRKWTNDDYRKHKGNILN